MKNTILFPVNPTRTLTVTDDASLDDLNLDSWQAFQHILYVADIRLATFARWLNDPASEPEIGTFRVLEQVTSTYEQFRNDFRETTGVGIMLEPLQTREKNAAEHPLFVLDADDLAKRRQTEKPHIDRLAVFSVGVTPVPKTKNIT